MSKISCDIIKDLIPLYVDNVCSNDTKIAIEEHIGECKSCSVYCSDLKNAPVLPGVSTDIDKAVFKVGKRIKKHTKKAVIKAVSIILSIVLVIGVFAFLSIPLSLAKKSYNSGYGLKMQCNHTDLQISNKKKPNFNGKFGSVYIDKSFGEYKVVNNEGSQQLVFGEDKKITFMRYMGEEVEATPFTEYCASEYIPFITTHLPFLIPVIEKGAENLGFSFEDIDNTDLGVQKFLAETHCDEIDGYFEECAYYYLYELIMPFTNGAYIVAENDVCEGYGFTLYNEYGTSYMIELQLKDKKDVKCSVFFVGFSQEEAEEIIDSLVIVE